MSKLNLRPSEQQRIRLTKTQQKRIRALYQAAAAEIAERIPSTGLHNWQLRELQKQINIALDNIQTEIERTVRGNMRDVAQAVVADNITFLSSVGMPMRAAFTHVPDDIVRTVATGQLYERGWTLSKALWKNTKKTKKDINFIIATGIAENKSAYDIAKELEIYVNPSAKKDWNWSKVYPHTSKTIDYNAQRLARTMVSHAYQQAFVKTTEKNPFVTRYRWVSAGGARVCQICAERDGMEFAKDDLPLDHPNGMCTFIAVIDDSMTDIADRIADWANGGTDAELDEFAEMLNGE